MKNITYPFIAVFLYLVVQIWLQPAYGINWDETAHFMRGQSFLRYYLSGRQDYRDLPVIDFGSYKNGYGYEFSQEDGSVIRRGIYQHDERPFLYYSEDIAKRGSHPAFSDVISATSNYIFFQKLGISPDVESYNYYSVFLGAVLVFAIYVWTRSVYGGFAGLIAALSLALFPLFFAEIHYNIKDVPQTVFFSLAIFFFYHAIRRLSLGRLILFSLFAGFAFATKFNFGFAIFILSPWLVYEVFTNWPENNVNIRKFVSKHRYFLAYLLFVPLVMLVILVLSWPAVWIEPRLLLAAFNYYGSIGTGAAGGLKLYSLYYLAYATPVVILVYAVVGIAGGLLKLKGEQRSALYLIVLWLIVPIVRVMLPRMTIYGGVRQIMEYIPALCILAGIGAGVVINTMSRYRIMSQVIAVILFVPLTYSLIKLHPNEGVYFNSLIGGISGAKEANIPDVGNSLGNSYRQGINWINDNTEPGSTLLFGYELWANIPHIWVRNDILFKDVGKTGPLQKGEYIISDVTAEQYLDWYKMRYVENILEPVYVVEVDGVPLVKIWKNDFEHTKKEFQNVSEQLVENVEYGVDIDSHTLKIYLHSLERLARIELVLAAEEDCYADQSYMGAFILFPEKRAVPADQYDYSGLISYSRPFFLFAGDEAKQIHLNYAPFANCLEKVTGVNVYSFVDEQSSQR
ncbi:MAG: glycosyltransferase family 39 protein [bacterium]|nr:glycosyltransferase family 39 protein [bacterium]